MRSRLLLVAAGLAVLLVVGAAWFAMRPGDPPIGKTTAPKKQAEEATAPSTPPGMEPVAGAVLDEEGNPVPGADVYLLAPGDPLLPKEAPFRGRTNEEGRFSLGKREGEAVDLIAVCPGFRPELLPSVSSGRGHLLTLSRGKEVKGRVRDDLGRPVAGVQLTARTAESMISPPRGVYFPHHETLLLTYARTLTGLDGSFTLRGIGEGPLEIVAKKRRYPDSPLLPVPHAGGDPLVIVIPRPFTASVTIRDAVSGKPIPGVAVKIELLDIEGKPAKGMTDYRGQVRVALDFPAARAPDTRVRVTAFSTEHGEDVADGVPLGRVEEGNGFSLVLTVRAPATLRVKAIYDTGQPYRGWISFALEPSVGSATHRWGRVDEEGFVTVKVPPGTYRVSQAYGGGTALDVAGLGSMVLRSGAVTEDTLTIRRGADLKLELIPEGGARLRGGVLQVESEGTTTRRGIWGTRVVLNDLRPGKAKLILTIPGYEKLETEVVLTKNEKAELELPLTREVK